MSPATAPSRRAAGYEPSSASFLLVVHVEVVEHLRRTLDACHVVVMRHGYTGHEHRDSSRFGPVKLRVFEVDVVHDFGDGPQRPVVEPQTIDQDLEGAAIAVVREVRVEHVEAD